MERRRSDLAAEYERGEKLLTEMNARQNELRTNLLRIGGALQVLDELLAVEVPNTATEPQLHRAAAG
jgi:hypothetical protein